MNKKEFERKWKEIEELCGIDGIYGHKIILSNRRAIIYCTDYKFINGQLSLYIEGYCVADININAVESVIPDSLSD